MSLYEVLLLYTPVEVQWSSVSTGIGFVNIWADFHKPGQVSEITGLETGKDWLHNKIQIKSQPLWQAVCTIMMSTGCCTHIL